MHLGEEDTEHGAQTPAQREGAAAGTSEGTTSWQKLEPRTWCEPVVTPKVKIQVLKSAVVINFEHKGLDIHGGWSPELTTFKQKQFWIHIVSVNETNLN